MSERPKVLVVGAGPTGLTMAHQLARDGMECRVIDKAPHRAMESRAVATHSRTLETFELMRTLGDFLAEGQRITSLRIDGDRRAIAHIDRRRRLALWSVLRARDRPLRRADDRSATPPYR